MLASATHISEFLALWLSKETLPEAEQKILWQCCASYRQHFPPRLHYYRRQTDEIMESLRRNPGARALEIGCGTGTESLWMAMRGAQVDAIDLSQERFRTATTRKAVLERELGRPLSCRFINETVLDLLWMEQTFHHPEPRGALFDKLASILRPGGHVVVSDEASGLNPLLQAQLRSRRGFSLFPNSPAFDGLLALEEAAPRWALPLFTHDNYVGVKRVAWP